MRFMQRLVINSLYLVTTIVIFGNAGPSVHSKWQLVSDLKEHKIKHIAFQFKEDKTPEAVNTGVMSLFLKNLNH